MTELIWEGKYDKDGRKTAPLRVALPFQTVETVNESAQERQRSLDLFSTGREPEWRNRLIWGDKKFVLPSLLPEFAGKVDLIYIDPPFDTGADFSYIATVPDDPDTEDDQGVRFVKEPSIIEQKAYRDTWGRGLDSYLQWFYETVLHLRDLLAEDGTLYVHLDWHIGNYARVVLDEVFGPERCLNEIAWKRTGAHNSSKRYGPVHDVLFFYTRSDKYTWNQQHQGYAQEYVDVKYRYIDEKTGQRYRTVVLTGPGTRTGASGQPWRGYDPTADGRHWALASYVYDKYSVLTGDDLGQYALQERLDRLDEVGLIHWPKKSGGKPEHKCYLEDMAGLPLQDVWTDLAPINSQATERIGYPTQKPEALLERIIKASSDEGDLVLDCFCGSGTTAVAAEKLGRHWIAADLGRFAIHTTRKRLLEIPNVTPFVVQNLGKYERQAWQAVEFGEQAEERALAYRRFILDLYRARPLSGPLWLHGVKGGRMVHVGAVDSPVSVGDVTQIAAEFRKVVGTGKDAPTSNGVDVLGWDFAFELNEVARQHAARANIEMRFIRIPREVLEKKAVEQGDIRFFELAALSADVATKGREVTLTLTDFVIPVDDVPDDVQKAITHWSQWIDYWAVDWDNKGDTFHNEWQTYRTRKNRDLQRSARHLYDAPGEYSIVVKVIDILGNDTTKTVKVRVK
jgi:adenine-specific DNA-methyltransferase